MDLVSDERKTITYNVNNEKLDVHPIGVVDDSIIIKVWEELRKELKEKGYSTDGKIMPEVVALLISSDEFDVFFKGVVIYLILSTRKSKNMELGFLIR